MTETTKASPLCALAAAVTLVSAGLVPVTAAPEITTHAVAEVSAEVTLAAGTIFDGLADAVASDTPGVAAAFDFAGLLNAEFAAAQGFVNSLFSLPVTLFNDVQGVITNLVDLNFGSAFSDLVSIPQDIINYVLGLPGLVINTVYDMAVVLPGEYLFNFG